MTTLSIDPIHRWPTGCKVTRHGPLTTIALDADFDVTDTAGLDRTAALTIDLPGLDMLVVDLCDVTTAGFGLVPWLMRVDAWARRAGAALVVLAEPGPVLDALRETPLRTLRGSASVV